LVVITNNAVLSNIDGLSSLSSLDYIGCAINISNNPSLKNVNGLTSLSEFGPLSALSSIAIYNNALLENIDGLSNLRGHYGLLLPTYITITDNPSLSRCSGLRPLLVSLGWDVVTEQIANNSFTVEENGAGCTIEDIIYGGPQLIEAFTVINEKTGVAVNLFFDDVTLDVADPEFSNWAIEAHTFPSPVGAVQFKLQDKAKHTDKVAPYTFVPHPLHKVGTYTFSATPYSSNKKGEPGIPKTATITVINSGANNLIVNNQDQGAEVFIYPVPVENELHLKVNDKAGNNAVLTIRNMQGNVVYTGSYSGQESQTSGINTLSFQPGVYVLQVFGSNGFHKAVRFIKK
jgi:hypothetical protein